MAYEDAFFIGMVMNIESDDFATVQFLQRGYKDVTNCLTHEQWKQ